MRLRFDVDSRIPILVLRDPSAPAVKARLGAFGSGRLRRAAVEAAHRHQLLLVESMADGPQSIEVLVDEPVPKHLVERSWLRVDDLGLRVPSGRLSATGLERIGRQSADEGSAIPAGAYRVTVLAPDWSFDEAPPLQVEEPRVGRTVVATNTLLASAACLAILLLVVGLRTAWPGALLWSSIPLGLAWAAAAVANRPRRGELARMRRAALEVRYPSLVVRLRRLPQVEDVFDLVPSHVDLGRPADEPLSAVAAR